MASRFGRARPDLIEDHRNGSMLDRANSMVDKYSNLARAIPETMYDNATRDGPLDRYKDNPVSQDLGYNDIGAAAKDDRAASWRNSQQDHDEQEANGGSDPEMNDMPYADNKAAPGLSFTPASDRLDPDIWSGKQYRSGQDSDEAGFESAIPEDVPGYAKGGPVKDRMAIIHKVMSHGRMKYGLGGSVQKYAEGGSVQDDGDYAIPQDFYDDPSQQDANTRQAGLDGSGLGGAFREAQEKRIADQRMKALLAAQEDPDQAPKAPAIPDEQGNDVPLPRERPQQAALPDDEVPLPRPRPDSDEAEANRDTPVAQMSPVNADSPFNVRAGLKRLYGYMTGDVAHPSEVAANEQKVAADGHDPHSEDGRIAAVEKAFNDGGPDAAWRMIGSFRHNANELRHIAKALADNGQTEMASQLGAKALSYVPNGMTVGFTPAEDGSITATVTKEGKPMFAQKLTPEQFSEYMGSQHSEFDNHLQGDPAKGLAAAAQAGQGAQAQQAGGQKAGGPFYKGINDKMRNDAMELHPWLGAGADARARFLENQITESNKNEANIEGNQLKNEGAYQRAVVGARGRENVASIQADWQRDRTGKRFLSSEAHTNMLGQIAELANSTKLRNAQQHEVYANMQKLASANPAFGPDEMEEYAKKHGLKLNLDPGGNINLGATPKLGQAPMSVETPPVQGANKAPDGHWYVQKDGKYFRVDK